MKVQYYSIGAQSATPSGVVITFNCPSDSPNLQVVFLHVSASVTDSILPLVSLPCRSTAALGFFAGQPIIAALQNVSGGTSNGLEFFFSSESNFMGELFIGNRSSTISLSASAQEYSAAPANPVYNFQFTIGFAVPETDQIDSNLQVIDPKRGEKYWLSEKVFPPLNPTKPVRLRQ